MCCCRIIMHAVLFPGWYAANITSDGVITVSKACPQGYYCPGGPAQSVFDATNPSSLSPTEPSIIACPSGMWTLDVAATSVDQCCESFIAAGSRRRDLTEQPTEPWPQQQPPPADTCQHALHVCMC